MEKMIFETQNAVRVSLKFPQELVDFLNQNLEGDNKVATWHKGGDPTDYSDVFLLYDHGEFVQEIPESVAVELRPHIDFKFGVVWLVNEVL